MLLYWRLDPNTTKGTIKTSFITTIRNSTSISEPCNYLPISYPKKVPTSITETLIERSPTISRALLNLLGERVCIEQDMRVFSNPARGTWGYGAHRTLYSTMDQHIIKQKRREVLQCDLDDSSPEVSVFKGRKGLKVATGNASAEDDER